MNATQTAHQPAATASGPSELTRLLQKTFTPQDLMDGDNLDRLERIAIRMSEGRMTVPEHLRNNVGDCMANSEAQFATSPDIDKELNSAVMDALSAHTEMSKQALEAATLRAE